MKVVWYGDHEKLDSRKEFECDFGSKILRGPECPGYPPDCAEVQIAEVVEWIPGERHALDYIRYLIGALNENGTIEIRRNPY